MGNCCSCCRPDKSSGTKSPLPEGRSPKRYEKLSDDSTPEVGRTANGHGRKKPLVGGMSEQEKAKMRGTAKANVGTLLEMATLPPHDGQLSEEKLPPVKDCPSQDEDEPGPFADPSAILRRETIAPSEKPWLVENVTESDYKQDEGESESNKNFYKEQSERQKDPDATEWTRNRRRAIHRTEASPSSHRARLGLKSEVMGANTPPTAASDSSVGNINGEQMNSAQVIEPVSETKESKSAGKVDVTSASLVEVETTPSSDPFFELSKRPQPAAPSDSAKSSASHTLSGMARTSEPVTSGSTMTAVPDPRTIPTPISKVSPENTEGVRQTSARPADSSSGQSTITAQNDVSQHDSGIKIKISSEPTEPLPELLPGDFTPPRPRSGGVSRGSKLPADSSSLTGSTGSGDSGGWVQLSSDVELSFGPGQLKSSRTTANCHIGDLLICLYQEKSNLQVRIQEGRNVYTKEEHHSTGLFLNPQRWDSSSIYVKCYVESNGKHVKQKTSTVSASHSPKFNETLKFKPSWQNKQLRVMIWADHMLSRNIMLGEALIALSNVQFSKTDSRWYSLFTADESISPSVSVSSLSSFASSGSPALLRHASGRKSKRH